MAEIINVPRYILMLAGYLCFLFGSGGLTFRIISYSSETGNISIIDTIISVILMLVGLVLVFIAYKLNKYKSKPSVNTN